MKKSVRTVLCLLLAASMLLCCTGCKGNKIADIQPAEETPEPVYDGPVGYEAAVPFGEGFVACGTGGRIDLIAIDGTVTTLETGTTQNLHAVYAEDAGILAAGDGGTVLLSSDGGESFEALDLGTEADLYGVAVFKGEIYAGGEGGIVYKETGDGWDAIQLETENTLIGVTAIENAVVAITAETGIGFCSDGQNWNYQDFNALYDGLYPVYTFTRLVPAGETVFILGYPQETPNMPLIMYSDTGEVWMQKELIQVNGEYVTGEEKLRINDICFNIDQIVGAMDDGNLLSITNCAKCNEATQLEGVTQDLRATAVQEDGILVCGEDFFSRVIDGKQIRQDKIQAEQAQIDVEFYGAVLIDVREADELAEDGYIPGSIHIPLAEVEERLPEVVPDVYTEVIFYCASGKRSQTATEQAVAMGYQEVYNLGGLSDWPYEIVKD